MNTQSKIGVYLRVSTDKQETALQTYAINEWLRSKGLLLNVVREYRDTLSGASTNRPGYKMLCEAVERGEIDSVVVYRLDRLSRNATEALQILLRWIQKDVEFVAVDQPILQFEKTNPFRLTILAIFSELAQVERETIVSRVKAGLRAAKARGVRLGRPSSGAVTDDVLTYVRKLRGDGKSLREIADTVGVSKTTLLRHLKESV